MMAMLGPKGLDHLDVTIVSLKRKLDVINAVAHLDLLEQPRRVLGVHSGLVEHDVDLGEEFAFGRQVLLRGSG